MPKVVLHGELAEKFHPEYNLNIKAPNEAIRALCNLVPGFTETLKQGSYYVFVELPNDQINIDEDNLNLNINGDVHIMPEIVGAKKHGLGKILMGIALVTLAFVPGVNVAVAGFATAGFTAEASVTAAAAISLGFHALTAVGMALILGGASKLLAPKSKANDSATQDQSYLINGSDVTISNGSAVPIVYGELLAGTVIVSQQITDAAPTDQTNNNATITTPGFQYDGTTGWYWGGMYFAPNIPV